MTNYRLYVHTPTAAFKARVNLGSPFTYPITSLPFNSVSLGAYTDIKPGMTLFLGTTDGADDLGRVRVKSAASSTAIPLPRTARGTEDGTLEVQDSAYITVLEDFRIWAKIPYFDLGDEGNPGNDYKDGDVAPGTNNTDIPPVANIGPAVAGYIDPDTLLLTVTFPEFGTNSSFAMAEGATITDFLWDVGDGTITVGTSASIIITATFPAGFRWVSLKVTDSNNKSHTAWCPVLAINPDDDPTILEFSATQRLEARGQTLDVQLLRPLPRADYPDGTLVLFWWGDISSPGDRSHMKFVGWLDREGYSVDRRKQGLVKGTDLHCVDAAQRLSLLPGFPQALERVESDSLWSWMPDLDMAKSLYYLLYWHSTALEVCDFIMPADAVDYDAMRLDASGATLFNQVDSQAKKMVPDHYFTCNTKGQLQIVRDWMLDDVGDRPTVAPILTESEWTGLRFDYNRHPKVHSLRSGAILSSTSFITVDGEDTLPLVFSIAPGETAAFSQGTIEATENEGLALSQSDLNKAEGHRYALLNSRYGTFSFSDPTASTFWDYEPANLPRIQLNIPATYAPLRSLGITNLVGKVKDISVSYRTSKLGVVVGVNVSLQKEEEGAAALTYNPDTGEVTTVPVVPPVESETPGLRSGVEQVAAILSNPLSGGYALYRTFDFQTPSGSGGPTWEEVALSGVTDTTLFSFVVDPFSPGYRGSGTEINGWVVGETDIWRIEDMFGTASATSVHTFATALPANHGWRTIQASFGRFFPEETDNPWLICISHYRDTVGHTGTWATYSVDGGQTWATEVLVSSHYDSSSDTSKRPFGVYCSPKTPGYGITTAYITTDAVPVAAGFVTLDWGATWTQMADVVDDDPDEPQPHWAIYRAGVGLQSTSVGGGHTDSAYAWGRDGSDMGPLITYILLAPPADAVRVLASCSYTATVSADGNANGSVNSPLWAPSHGLNVDLTEDLTYVGPPTNGGSVSNSYTVEWTRELAQTEWPRNRDTLDSSPPATNTAAEQYAHFRLSVFAGTVGLNTFADALITHQVTIDEIELENGHIYTPPAATLFIQSGGRPSPDLHVPWPTNDDEGVVYHGYTVAAASLNYRTKRIVSGTVSDISPSSSGVNYGIGHYGFALRTFDNDRSYVALGGVGNDATNNPINNSYGAWVSSNNGDSWTQVIAPLAATNFLETHGFSLAFGANDSDVLFVWGPLRSSATGLIQYSDDGGATLDNREGDMGTGETGTWALIGIAGGPLV